METQPSYGSQLASSGARCAAILVTHADADHVVGLADLAEGTEAPVYAPPKELMPAERATGWLAVRPYDIDTEVTGGETLDVAGITFEVIADTGPLARPRRLSTPTAASSRAISSSPARSVASISPAATGTTLLESARALIERYPPETTVYSGHGPPTTLGAEQERNPFLAELRA